MNRNQNRHNLKQFQTALKGLGLAAIVLMMAACTSPFHVANRESDNQKASGTGCGGRPGCIDGDLPRPTPGATPVATPRPPAPTPIPPPPVATATPFPSTPTPTPTPSATPMPPLPPPPPSTPAPGANCLVPDPPTLSASERGRVKFQPGHYVAIGAQRAGRPNILEGTLNEIASIPAIVGVQKRYYWSDMHKGRGANDFDFTQLKADIALAKAKGKRLSVMIMWKFSSDGGGSPVPAHIDAMTTQAYQYEIGGPTLGIFANGYLAAFNNPVVVQEFARFLVKLSQEIDSDNTVANIVFPETAMGVDFKRVIVPEPTAAQITEIKNKFVDGVLNLNKYAVCAFRHTPVIQLTNAPINRLDEISKVFMDRSIGMGGPDVWIKDDALERPTTTWPKRAYDYYPEMEVKLPIGMIIAGGNYLFREHYPETIRDATVRATYTHEALSGWNPERTTLELGKKAINQLKANYIFWKKNGASGDEFYTAALAQLKKIGTPGQTIPQTHSDCPTNYAGRCVTTLPPSP